jgi:MFS family permease
MKASFLEGKKTYLQKKPKGSPAKISRALMLFTALNELANNLVYVSLLEKAHVVGGGVASIGVVLIIQSVAQMFMGTWAGSLVDRLGTRRAATLGTISQFGLAVGLIFSQSIVLIYLLAFNLMLARLLIIPARLAFVSQARSRKKLVGANTALEALTGAGLFFGPAIGAALVLLTHRSVVPPFAASLLFLLAALPLLTAGSATYHARDKGLAEKKSVLKQIRTAWGFIGKHRAFRLVLFCMVHSTMLLAALMPLLTPLSRQFGFGDEGTAVFVAAIGLGHMSGPFLAPLLFKRMKHSFTLLLAGLIPPLAIMLIGGIRNAGMIWILGAISAVSLADSSLRVIVNTILQRLTPGYKQGCVFGSEQTLLGLGWIMSLVAITALVSTMTSRLDVNGLLIFVGGGGLLMIASCWVISRHEIQNIRIALKSLKDINAKRV